MSSCVCFQSISAALVLPALAPFLQGCSWSRSAFMLCSTQPFCVQGQHRGSQLGTGTQRSPLPPSSIPE